MEILGVGTDLCSIERFRSARFPERAASFYLSENELRAAKNSRDFHQFLASRFAAKEAVVKASPRPLCPVDFEILKEGAVPSVRWLSDAPPYKVLLSISHEGRYACAFALCVSP
ncbi:MAG TPA: holo-ACP synthase [Candidatus Paceibacterota bacterium]|jgi:phosphopantetheine--protein transferase-like protein|nr:holo-ACP synthase [Candidatus Paceibacterota bacterium]